jgi:hypothetical protein
MQAKKSIQKNYLPNTTDNSIDATVKGTCTGKYKNRKLGSLHSTTETSLKTPLYAYFIEQKQHFGD